MYLAIPVFINSGFCVCGKWFHENCTNIKISHIF